MRSMTCALQQPLQRTGKIKETVIIVPLVVDESTE